MAVKVSPMKDVASTMASNNGSGLLQSMASLSPSQLDQALMEMMNIQANATDIRQICEANPITKMGKRIQLMRMIGITMIPITLLLALLGAIFLARVQEYVESTHVRGMVEFSVEFSYIMHNLQRERDASGLYVAAFGPDTKAELVARYAQTDVRIKNLSHWPTSFLDGAANINATYLHTKEKFQNFLNKHRDELDTKKTSVFAEVSFYSGIITAFTNWMYDAITETGAGTVSKQLVALVELIDSKEMFGVERAYGGIYFNRGGCEGREEYLVFAEAQDVANASLWAARQYSSLVEAVYQDTVAPAEVFSDTIRHFRYTIRLDPFGENMGSGSEDNATWWYYNMTNYIDALLMMQRNLTEKIRDILLQREMEDQTVLVSLGILMAICLVVTPVILMAVYSLTTEIHTYSITLADKTKALNKEQKRTDTLLYQMLPKAVAEQLKKNEQVSAEAFADVTIFFSDLVGFTAICARGSPIQVVDMLDQLHTCFDKRINIYDVYRVETIGDAYIVTSGLPKRNGKRHAAEIGTMALDLLDHILCLEISHMPGNKFRLRIGCHTGNVVAGIVGSKMPRYCLFGETVNVASKMESSGAAGRVHISMATHVALTDLGGFIMRPRDEEYTREVRQKTFWLLQRTGMLRCNPDLASSVLGSVCSRDSNYGDRMLKKEEMKNKQETIVTSMDLESDG